MRVETIGDCTLILGNSCEIVPTLGSIGSIVTDPPFGMAFKSNHRAVSHKAIANDEGEEMLIWATNLQATHSKYIFCRWDNLATVPKPKSLITWVKNNWSMGDLDHEHARQTEVCLFYPGEGHFFPSGRPSDVIEAPRTGNNYHPTEKPIFLMRHIVRWTDGVILDPFMGSGSTLVAAAKEGRKATGIELDEGYFETAVKRVKEAYSQPDFFTPQPTKMVQEPLI